MEILIINLLLLFGSGEANPWQTWKALNPSHPPILVVGCNRDPSQMSTSYCRKILGVSNEPTNLMVEAFRCFLSAREIDVGTAGDHKHEGCVVTDILGGDIPWDMTKPIPQHAHGLFTCIYVESLPTEVLRNPVTFQNLWNLLSTGGHLYLDYNCSIIGTEKFKPNEVRPFALDPFTILVNDKTATASGFAEAFRANFSQKNGCFEAHIFPALKDRFEQMGLISVFYFLPSKKMPIPFNKRTDAHPVISAMKPFSEEEIQNILQILKEMRKSARIEKQNVLNLLRQWDQSFNWEVYFSGFPLAWE